MATNTEKIVVQIQIKGQKDLDKLGVKTDKATKKVGGLNKSFVKMAAGVLGAAAAFRTISSIIGKSIQTFKDFEFQMAKVKAITGANRTEFLLLSRTAQELGRSTFFTATQVAELQTNYGKLGFTTDEILNAQEATLALATATGSDLARAAIVAGSAVRGFGLDASETGRVTDVMALAFTSSALDIEKWQTSMTKVAPIAKSAGFSIEDTSAIMAQLADSGIEASIAGTSLRNILLKMQDPNSDLVKSFGKTIHSLDDLVPAMAKFSKEGGSLAEIMEIVDVRQVSAFEQMITSRQRTLELRDALKDASGAAEEMARIVGDNLEGALKRSESAWQGFQIAFVDGFGESLKNITDGFANFINKVTDFIETPISQKVNEDRLAMNDLFNALQETNTSQDTRNKLVAKLNLEYGEYLPNIVTEKTNLEDLKKAQVEANAAMLQRVSILAAEEKLTEIRKKQIENEIEAANLIVKKQKALRVQVEARINTNKRLQTSLSGVDVEMSNANLSVTENTENLRRNNEQAEELSIEYETAATAALNLGVDVDALVQSLNISTTATNQSTDAIANNTKAKELNNDVDKEMLDFRVTQMMMGYLKEEEISQLQRDLKKREIQDLRNLLKVQGAIGIDRMAIAQRIFDLEKDLEVQSQADKDKAFAEDVKRAALSGESAQDAAKRLIRAKIMEAVSLYIVGAFAANPILGAIVAAGAGSLVSGVFENAFSNITFANGGMIEEFANGGLVQGKSHAQGGEKFAVGGRVVELEGGEAVINKRSTSMFSSQLSAMNAAGGGVKFADGGLLNQPSFSQQQFNALGQNQMMGAMSNSGKVTVVEADITSSQNTVSVIQSQATI